jgi:hypothetical protein
MNRFVLIIMLCSLAGTSGATFELTDPSQVPAPDIEDVSGEITFFSGDVEEKVIVPVGTYLYAPEIIQGDCVGWLFDEPEAAMDTGNELPSKTKTTYAGVILKTLECKNKNTGEALRFALIQIETDRLIWVELGRVLAASYID